MEIWWKQALIFLFWCCFLIFFSKLWYIWMETRHLLVRDCRLLRWSNILSTNNSQNSFILKPLVVSHIETCPGFLLLGTSRLSTLTPLFFLSYSVLPPPVLPVITTLRTRTSTGSCVTPAPWGPFTWSSPTCCRGSGCRRFCPWTTAWRRWVDLQTEHRGQRSASSGQSENDKQNRGNCIKTVTSVSLCVSAVWHAGGHGRVGQHLYHLHVRSRLPHRTVRPRQR